MRSWRQVALEIGRVLLTYSGIQMGPIVLTSATLALYALLAAEALHDGQFRMIYFVTVPFGLLLGGVAGATARLLCARKRRAAASCTEIGGLVVVLLAIAVLLLGASPFGYLEVLLVLAAGTGMSIAGTWIAPSRTEPYR